MSTSANILLTTPDARYMHTAFGLRYLYANMGPLQSQTKIIEFTIQELPINIAEQLLSHHPKVIGFSVYIWNVSEVSKVVAMLKQIAPEVKIVFGGPEVSHQPDVPSIADSVDFIISGPGEQSFPELCQQILDEDIAQTHYIEGKALALDELVMPYQYYNDEDIRNRLIYVEASRGCPFKCEFCLSALDKTAKPFSIEPFLDEMEVLLERGLRNFKFIDRTFNLKIATSIRILEFFLERMTDDLYLHFEVVPDHLPDKLKDMLKCFPANSLQFEIGVQTFDPDIQNLISRKQNNEKTKANLTWLRENTGAHLHTDLIFGLPSDSLNNFADSFDQLIVLKPHEIQLGILKRLRGAPLNRHNETYQLRYNPEAPYNILSTSDITFQEMQIVNRFARFWDMIGNSGRFANTLPIILKEQPFQRFLQLSEQLYQRAGSSWKITLKRQFELIYTILTDHFSEDISNVKSLLAIDYQRSKLKGVPAYELSNPVPKQKRTGTANKRQQLHQLH